VGAAASAGGGPVRKWGCTSSKHCCSTAFGLIFGLFAPRVPILIRLRKKDVIFVKGSFLTGRFSSSLNGEQLQSPLGNVGLKSKYLSFI